MPVVFDRNFSMETISWEEVQNMEIKLVCDFCGKLVLTLPGMIESPLVFDAKMHIIYFHHNDKISCIGGCEKEIKKVENVT